jgi:hypothetical protein
MRPLRMLAGSQKRKLVEVSREIVADEIFRQLESVAALSGNA